MSNTKKYALVFPGQGSQKIGMLAELAAQFPQIAATFKQASAVLGNDLWQIAQQGPQEIVDQTAITQPIMLAADIAVYRCWQQQAQATPIVVAGHSLGEYAALVVAEVLSFDDAITLVAKRGQYMQAAVSEGVGAMAAIIGLDDEKILQLCEDCSQGEILAPANFNSIGQTVIAGHVAAIERAIPAAKAAGAKIAKRIPVSVPSHCDLMRPAAVKLEKELAAVSFATPKITVLHNVNVKYYHDASLIRQLLLDQLVSPVRWVETIQRMVVDFGVTAVMECGPGKVLAGLIKRVERELPVFSVGLSPEIFASALSFSE